MKRIEIPYPNTFRTGEDYTKWIQSLARTINEIIDNVNTLERRINALDNQGRREGEEKSDDSGTDSSLG